MLILAFEVIMQPLVHIPICYCIIFLAYCADEMGEVGKRRASFGMYLRQN